MKTGKMFAALCILLICAAAAPAAAATADDVSGGGVTVRKGQSLGSIATQHGVTVRQLMEWNNLASPDKVRDGQKLIVRPPSAGSAVAGAAKNATSATVKSAGKKGAKAEPAPASSYAVQAVEVAAPEGVPDKVKSDLSGVARALVQSAAGNIRPSAAAKAVAPGAEGGFTASYIEVDTTDVRAEVLPSAEKGKYVGSIRYAEHYYECSGKSKEEALRAECGKVKSRRMNELIRYEQGKWHY